MAFWPALKPLRWPRSPGRSLQLRLLLPVGLLATAGLALVTAGSAWQMQRLLIGGHKQTLDYIAQQVPKRLAAEPGDRPIAERLQQTIDSLASDDAMLWVRSLDGAVLTESGTAAADALSAEQLEPYLPLASTAHVIHLGDRHLLACSLSLSVQPGTLHGAEQPLALQLYLAHDITAERQQIITGLRNLILVSLGVMCLLLGALACSIRQALAPLARMNRLARELSVGDLANANVCLSEAQAPTEIQDLVEGFNTMLSRLGLAWQKQRQFVNDASHELRTPLSIIDGYLQSLLRRHPTTLNAHQLEALTAASEETQRTIQMLQEMLVLARADSNQLSFQPMSVPLAPLLATVATQAELTHGRAIELQLPRGYLNAWADPVHLQRVLANVLENALKYSDARSPIQLRLAHHGSEVAIAVVDQGIGIAPAQQAAVFERFFRADEARHRQGGTGLGLSLAQTLVEGMGGQIQLTSLPQKGSTFTILLPCAPSSLTSAAVGTVTG